MTDVWEQSPQDYIDATFLGRDRLAPPPRNPARAPQVVEDFAYGATLEPLWDVAKGVGALASGAGIVPEVGAGLTGAIGLIGPMSGPGVKLIRSGLTPKAANAAGPPATAYDDIQRAVGNAMGEIPAQPFTVPKAANDLRLVPVNHDPFAGAPAGVRIVPVDHDPFAGARFVNLELDEPASRTYPDMSEEDSEVMDRVQRRMRDNTLYPGDARWEALPPSENFEDRRGEPSLPRDEVVIKGRSRKR